MQDGEEAESSAEMTRIRSDLEEGPASCLEQQTVKHPRILECERREIRGDREDHMSIGNR
jgi:hypothetical protein